MGLCRAMKGYTRLCGLYRGIRGYMGWVASLLPLEFGV